MSLQFWLPFTRKTVAGEAGLTPQQGVSSALAIGGGGSFDLNNDGKFGKCYYFTGAADCFMLTTFNTNIGTSDFSISVWVKIPTITSGTYFTICSSKQVAAASAGIGIYWNYTQKKFLWSTADGTNASEIWMASTVDTIVYDKWIHLVMVRNSSDPKVGYFYINGTRYELASVPAIRNITTATALSIGRLSVVNGYPCKLYINDLRFYNHALSIKEIKELSKGLVVHYTLGDRSIQQMNNCYSYPTFNTSSDSGGWSHWGGSGHIGTYGQNTNTNYIFRKGQSYSHWVANGSGATYNYLVYQSPAFDGGTRSLCCIIKHENSLPITNSICYPAWNARSGGTPSNAWTSIISLSNGFYLCKCENIQQDGSNDLVGIYVTAGNKIYISEGYLENDRVCCSDIFYNDTTAYDSSGYNYNGTSSGTITLDANTPKYGLSTHFSAGSGIFTSPALTLSQFTISFWAKHSAANKMVFGSNASTSSTNTNWYWYGDNSFKYPSGEFYYNHNAGSAESLLGTWIHFVATYDGTNITVYRNGVNEGSKAVTGNMTLSTMSIGNGYTSSSYWANSNMSDFRLYTTALSASDVLELYHLGASIDNSGNMYAYELREL